MRQRAEHPGARCSIFWAMPNDDTLDEEIDIDMTNVEPISSDLAVVAEPEPLPVTPIASTCDPECKKLGRHRQRCACTGEMRGPI